MAEEQHLVKKVKNIVIFGADSISLSDTDNRKKHLVLGEGPTDSTNVSTGRAKRIQY